MAKLLLSSSQVQVLVSSIIVVSCTLALFLSGYAIQQRTLRELRVAIKPRPRAAPKIYLPDKFKARSTQPEDGPGMTVEGYEEEETAAEDETVIEVRETQPEDEAEPAEKGPKAPASKEKMKIVEELKAKLLGKKLGTDHPDPLVQNHLPISKAERRRLIKKEIRKLAQSDKPTYYQRRLW